MSPPKTFGKFNRAAAAKNRPNDEAKFERDEAYESSPGVREALAAIDQRAPVIMIVGRAGTGKTRLVHYQAPFSPLRLLAT
jgi:polynucleotide 5'-kinase involved in rRNA processing